MTTQNEPQTLQQDTPAPSVTIDGKRYAFAQLSENAKQQLANIRMADLELARLQGQVALAQTARNVYMQVLKAEVAQTKALED